MQYISVSVQFPAVELKQSTEDVALSFVRSMSTLQYLDIKGVEFFIEKAFNKQRSYWRVVRDVNKDISGEIKGTGPGLVRVTKLDDEDGENAHEFFDWKEMS